ncbi:MAG: tRNA (N6-threonylcarbamoyladenosine(37)-N6)-methyltransferase TrmO [archaeon]
MNPTELEIGRVRNGAHVLAPGKRVPSEIVVRKEYSAGLRGLEKFSHIIVIFRFHKKLDTALLVHPMRNPNLPEIGVFATRSPFRPAKIGVSVVRLEKIRGNVLSVDGLDALDGTPVIDIKPYIPERDGPAKVRTPGWVRKEMKSNGEEALR